MKGTKFYINNFKCPYPAGKIYSYLAGTDTLEPTYKSQDGTLNTNPIVLNSKGMCSIFLDKDKEYKFKLYDYSGELVDSYDNIKQLAGKDGGEPDPTPPTPEELAKYKGPTGIQGVSTIGPDGEKGPDGDQGPAFFERVALTNNQEFTVPAGIKEIFITACGGGGSAASWSNYFFLYDVLSQNQNVALNNQISLLYRLNEGGSIYNSKNTITQEAKDFAGLVLLPGSGFAGQSTFRQKFTFSDSTISHRVLAYIGVGGKYSNSTLNGSNGTSTKIYVDDKLVVEVAGGLGGTQQMPKDGGNIPSLGTITRVNRGFNNGLAYVRFTKKGDSSFQQAQNSYEITYAGNADPTYKTQYRKKFNNIFQYADVWIGTFFKEQHIRTDINFMSAFPYEYDKTLLRGQKSRFGDYYNQYNQQTDQTFYYTIRNSTKGVNGSVGAGAGGDAYYGLNNRDSREIGNYYGIYSKLFDSPSPVDFGIFDKTYLINRIRTMMQNFETSDNQTYTPGVEKVAPVDDPLFNILDNLNASMSAKSYYMFSSPGIYSIPSLLTIKPALPENLNNCRGGDGMDGYCFIEFGSITEH